MNKNTLSFTCDHVIKMSVLYRRAFIVTPIITILKSSNWEPKRYGVIILSAKI